MAWSVVISPSTVSDPNAFTINAAFKFDLDGRVHDDEFGRVHYIEWFVQLEGDIVATPQSAVATNLIATMNQLQSYQPRNVYLVLDGTIYRQWLTTNCIGSPRVMAAKTIDEDGNADSHWRYALTIYAKQQGNLPGGVLQLQTSLLVVTEKIAGQSIVVRKVWRASAQGVTISQALAQVLSFRPTDATIHEEIERFFQQNKVSATWVWELYKNLLITEDPIVWIGNGQGYVWDQQVGDPSSKPPAPIPHQKVRLATRAIVKGVVRGTDPDKLQAPPPHWNDDRINSFREFDEEETFSPGMEDPIRGIFKLPYSEIWYFPVSVPPPNHNGHLKPTFITAPGDGSIAG